MFDFINTLITSIQDFFEGLFFSSSPEYQKKRQLKGYVFELKKLNPPLYHTGKILLPAFGSLLYQLYHFLQPVKAVLDQTVNSSDIRVAEKYQALFFEAVLSEEQVTQHQNCTFQARNLVLSECDNYQEAEHKLQEQINEFKDFMLLFNMPLFKTREQELIKLFFLSDLCDFDYAAFLNRFHSNLQLSAGAPTSISQDNFEEVFGGDVIQNLLDFQFIVGHIAITQTTIDNVIFLARNLENFTDEMGIKLEKTLQSIENLLANQLKRTTIPIILKLISEDPNFEEKITVSEAKPLQEYIDRRNAAFQADSKRLLKIAKESNITGLIEKCFENSELKPLDGYNDTVNDAIQNLSTVSFDWIKPMQLLKAFTEVYFETHYKTVLKSLLIEGFFANKQIEGQYAAICRSCEMLLSKIKNFEQLFKSKGQCSLIEIQSYISEIEKGNDMKKQLQKIVGIANMQAKAVIENGNQAYIDLYAFTEHLLEDIKAPSPELITNIKTLAASSKNKEAFTRLEQNRHIFAMFLEIMKNYAVFSSSEKEKSSTPTPPVTSSAVPTAEPAQQ